MVIMGALLAILARTGTAAVARGTEIKDIIIYQPGGWAGVMKDHRGDYEWPAHGGMSAYRSRSPEILRHQMALIAGLGEHVAIGVLMMTDEDSAKSGYGTCWNGSWSGKRTCDSGELIYPFDMYDKVRAAARAAGVRYAPNFSMMNYDGARGHAVLEKLQQAIDWWRARLPDPHAAKDEEGRYYVIVDSLPQQTKFSDEDKEEIIEYMKSQLDIKWVDFMVNGNTPPVNKYYHDNVYHSVWGTDKVRNWLNSQQRDHLLWSFQTNFPSRSLAEARSPAKKIPEEVHEKWMNISPWDPSKYPVIIDQWNEYGEFLMFEPSTQLGTKNYDYLKWLISRQP